MHFLSEHWLIVLLMGLLAGGLSGLIGTGASLLLLPFLVPITGAVAAIPIMAIAGLMANFARVATWWRQVDLRAVLVYAATGMPAAAAGAYALVILPSGWAEMLLGLFIVLLVPVRRLAKIRESRIGLPQLAASGAVVGFLTGLFLSTGPLSVQAFLSYGLVRGAFIATEAAASLMIQASKITSFRQYGALSDDIVASGLLIGASLMLGTFATRPLVARISDTHFRAMMDIVTVVSGLWLFVLGLSQ